MLKALKKRFGIKSKKPTGVPFNEQLGIRQINKTKNTQKFSYNITNNIGVKIVSILKKILSKYYNNNDNLHIVTDTLLKFVQNNSKIINNTLKNKYLYCLTLDLILKNS